MPAVTGAFSELLVPGLSNIFYDSYKERAPEWSRYLNTRNSTRNFEEDLEMAAFGSAPQKTEGNPTQFQLPVQGTKRRYTHLSYGLGFRVTAEMMADDLYGPMRKASKGLGRSFRNTKEQVCANVLNLGTGTETGFKTEVLFTNSHTLLRGGTSSNKLGTDADLSQAGLESAIINIDNQLTEEGFPTMFIPKLLICGPDLQMIAEELLLSPMRPDTANNAINPLHRRGMEYMVSHYLTDADSWFIVCDEHDLSCFKRSALMFQAGDDFDTGDAKFKGFERFSVGHSDWRGTFGSFGTP